MTLTLKNGSYAAGNIENRAADDSLESSALTIVAVQNGAQWAGLVIDDMTSILDSSQPGQHSDFSTAGDMVLEGGSAPVTFAGTSNIGGNATGGQGAVFSFGAPAVIGANVQGAGGAAFTFSGPAQVGGCVQGLDGASFRFSTSAPTVIAGGLSLAGGSRLGGG
ncbi:hypothetical protein L522_2373 [Bordetella bronchiseptica MBORD707]|nr:hypothetical protein L522_2373 [Bordetella bronchiseptica MBORD707]